MSASEYSSPPNPQPCNSIQPTCPSYVTEQPCEAQALLSIAFTIPPCQVTIALNIAICCVWLVWIVCFPRSMAFLNSSTGFGTKVLPVRTPHTLRSPPCLNGADPTARARLYRSELEKIAIFKMDRMETESSLPGATGVSEDLAP